LQGKAFSRGSRSAARLGAMTVIAIRRPLKTPAKPCTLIAAHYNALDAYPTDPSL
jgi:hypothetical protein